MAEVPWVQVRMISDWVPLNGKNFASYSKNLDLALRYEYHHQRKP